MTDQNCILINFLDVYGNRLALVSSREEIL